MLYPSGETGKRACPSDSVHLPMLRVNKFTDVDHAQKLGDLLYGAFRQLLRDFGEQYNLCYGSDKTWKQRMF